MSPVLERVRAVSAYTADHVDELTIQVCVCVCVCVCVTIAVVVYVALSFLELEEWRQ